MAIDPQCDGWLNYDTHVKKEIIFLTIRAWWTCHMCHVQEGERVKNEARWHLQIEWRQTSSILKFKLKEDEQDYLLELSQLSSFYLSLRLTVLKRLNNVQCCIYYTDKYLFNIFSCQIYNLFFLVKNRNWIPEYQFTEEKPYKGTFVRL